MEPRDLVDQSVDRDTELVRVPRCFRHGQAETGGGIIVVPIRIVPPGAVRVADLQR
jgi:hypothetical protein